MILIQVIKKEVKIYLDIIELIKRCGGYIFFKQLYRYYKNDELGQQKIKNMLELGLVGKKRFNKNRYLYLKNLSFKCIKYKNSLIIPKNSKIKGIYEKPYDKIFITSIYKIEYYFCKSLVIDTKLLRNNYLECLRKIDYLLENDRLKYLYLVKNKNELKRKENYNELIKLHSYLINFDKNKNILKFVKFDFGENIEFIFKSIKKISYWINNFGTKNGKNIFNFNLEIITFSTKRMEFLKNEENKILKKIDTINQYNSKKTKKNYISGLIQINYTLFSNIDEYIF